MQKTINKVFHVLFALLCSLLMFTSTVAAESALEMDTYSIINIESFGDVNVVLETADGKLETTNKLQTEVRTGTKALITVEDSATDDFYQAKVNGEAVKANPFTLDTTLDRNDVVIETVVKHSADDAEDLEQTLKNMGTNMAPARVWDLTGRETYAFNKAQAGYEDDPEVVQIRKEKVEELGLENFVDEDYFLTEENESNPNITNYEGARILARPGIATIGWGTILQGAASMYEWMSSHYWEAVRYFVGPEVDGTYGQAQYSHVWNLEFQQTIRNCPDFSTEYFWTSPVNPTSTTGQCAWYAYGAMAQFYQVIQPYLHSGIREDTFGNYWWVGCDVVIELCYRYPYWFQYSRTPETGAVFSIGCETWSTERNWWTNSNNSWGAHVGVVLNVSDNEQGSETWTVMEGNFDGQTNDPIDYLALATDWNMTCWTSDGFMSRPRSIGPQWAKDQSGDPFRMNVRFANPIGQAKNCQIYRKMGGSTGPHVRVRSHKNGFWYGGSMKGLTYEYLYTLLLDPAHETNADAIGDSGAKYASGEPDPNLDPFGHGVKENGWPVKAWQLDGNCAAAYNGALYQDIPAELTIGGWTDGINVPLLRKVMYYGFGGPGDVLTPLFLQEQGNFQLDVMQTYLIQECSTADGTGYVRVGLNQRGWEEDPSGNTWMNQLVQWMETHILYGGINNGLGLNGYEDPPAEFKIYEVKTQAFSDGHSYWRIWGNADTPSTGGGLLHLAPSAFEWTVKDGNGWHADEKARPDPNPPGTLLWPWMTAGLSSTDPVMPVPSSEDTPNEYVADDETNNQTGGVSWMTHEGFGILPRLVLWTMDGTGPTRIKVRKRWLDAEGHEIEWKDIADPAVRDATFYMHLYTDSYGQYTDANIIKPVTKDNPVAEFDIDPEMYYAIFEETDPKVPFVFSIPGVDPVCGGNQNNCINFCWNEWHGEHPEWLEMAMYNQTKIIGKLGDITVYKQWKDGKEPNGWTITVQLYRNGSPYNPPDQPGTVQLNAGKKNHTWNRLDSADAWGTPYEYEVRETYCNIPGVTMTNPSSGVMYVDSQYTFTNEWETVDGKYKIFKTTSNPEMVFNNPFYTLAGAKFGFFEDAGCTKKAGEVTCNASGWSNDWSYEPSRQFSDDPTSGIYDKHAADSKDFWVKETEWPTGYSRNEKVIKFTITKKLVQTNHKTKQQGWNADGSPHYVPYDEHIYMWDNQDETFEFEDIPKSEEVDLVVVKGNYGHPSNITPPSLANAHFRIDFWASDTPQGTPVRSWTIKTDADGKGYLDQAHLVSGDPFYYNSLGNPAIPLGVIQITEVKAPDGYYRNLSKVEIFRITEDRSDPSEFLDVFQADTILDMTNHLDLYKLQASPIDGATYIPDVTFEWTKPDGSKETLTTDQDGHVQIWGLAFGTHKFVEKHVMGGYVNAAREFTVEVDDLVMKDGYGYEENVVEWMYHQEDLQAPTVFVYNDVNDWSLTLRKTNQWFTDPNNPDHTLANALFLIEVEDGNGIVANGPLYAAQTDYNGVLRFPQLEDRVTYKITELEAPNGYRDPVTDNSTMTPLSFTVRCESTPVKGMFYFYLNGKLVAHTDGKNLDVGVLSFDDVFVEGKDPNVNIHRINYTKGRLPETGSNQALMAGLLILGFGLMVLGYDRYRMNHKKH